MKRWMLISIFLLILFFIQGCSTSPDNQIFEINRCNEEIDSQVQVSLSEKIGDFYCSYSTNSGKDRKYGEVWEAKNGCTYIIHTRTLKGYQEYVNPSDTSKNFWNDTIYFETNTNQVIEGFVKHENAQYCVFTMTKEAKIKDCAYDKAYTRQICRVLEPNSELSVEQGWY